jgi:hypothetical protein
MADCECSVCYEGFTTAEGAKTTVVTLSCGHPFHFACITKWFSAKAVGTCPMCRKGMEGVDALAKADEGDDADEGDEADEADEGDEAGVTAVATAPRLWLHPLEEGGPGLPEWATAQEMEYDDDNPRPDPPVHGSFTIVRWSDLQEELLERGGSGLTEDMAVMCEPPTPDELAWRIRPDTPERTVRSESLFYLTRPVLNAICRVTGASLWADEDWFNCLEMDYDIGRRALPWEFGEWARQMEGVAKGARWAAAQAT